MRTRRRVQLPHLLPQLVHVTKVVIGCGYILCTHVLCTTGLASHAHTPHIHACHIAHSASSSLVGVSGVCWVRQVCLATSMRSIGQNRLAPHPQSVSEAGSTWSCVACTCRTCTPHMCGRMHAWIDGWMDVQHQARQHQAYEVCAKVQAELTS